MCGYTKAELKAMGNEKAYLAVKDWVTEDMRDAEIYLDADGKKTGQTFKDTSLENYVDDIVPDDYNKKMDSPDYIDQKSEQNKTNSDKEGTNSDTDKNSKDKSAEAEKKKETKKEAGDSDTKKDAKKETTDPGTKKDSKKETGDSDTKNHKDAGDNGKGNSDKSKPKTDLEDGKLSDKSKKYVDIYEDANGIKVRDVPDAKKINRITGALGIFGKDIDLDPIKVVDKIDDIGDLVDAAKTVYQAGQLFSEGKEDEAGKLLRDYGLSTLTSMALSELTAIALASLAVTNPILLFVTVGAMGFCGSEIGEMISDLLDEILGLYDDAGAYTVPVDPLVFDLDGDGVETVSVKDGVNFDFDNNGFAEKIGWAGADDGLLVRDLNQNGQIDNGGELFGDQTETGNGILAVNGFEALKAFDSNGDGMIDVNDQVYAELKIWQDRNQNGTAEEGELVSLQEAGITAIGLDYSTMSRTDAQGNLHTQKGYYVKSDGSTADVEDVWFSRDTADTVITGSGDKGTLLEETEDIRKLPDIQGQGNQYSLHQAMLRDSTGHLQRLVEQYVGEGDAGRRKELVTQIIYAWTGVEEYDPAGRGTALKDARELAALEVIAGREFDSRYGKNPVYQAGRYIEQAFDKLVELYHAELESQTTYADIYSYLSVSIDFDENGKLVRDTDKIVEKFGELYDSDPAEGRKYILRFVDNMEKLGITKDIDRDKFYTGLSAFCGDIEHAVAYMGDDVIAGTSGNDILTGEMGNDILRGGAGDDIYIFNPGDGQDVISETDGIDKIVFREGIKAEDLTVTRDSYSLYITSHTGRDRIKIENFFYGEQYQIESVEFSDGTVWTVEELQDRARYYNGTDGDDTISTYEKNRYADSSDDDIVHAGAGDDTYVFNACDGDDVIYDNGGTDRIVFGEGILAEDLKFRRKDLDLHITNEKTGDHILVRDMYRAGWSQVDSVEFADGTVWTDADIADRVRYHDGTAGDDTYLFNLGDGNDVICDTAGNDKILFGENITKEDLVFSRSNNALCIFVMGTDQSIVNSNYYYSPQYRVEEIETSDGYVLDCQKLDLVIQTMAGCEDETGMSWQDAVEQDSQYTKDLMDQWWTQKTE